MPHQVKSPTGEFAGGAEGIATLSTLAPSAQNRAYPGEQLARIARLGQIVVGAQFQTDDPISVLAHGAQHDDGRTIRPGEPATYRQPVLARKHDIQNHEIGSLTRQHPIHLARVGRRFHGKAMAAQELGHDFANSRVVVDDQDARGGLRSACHLVNIAHRRPGFTRCVTDGCRNRNTFAIEQCGAVPWTGQNA